MEFIPNIFHLGFKRFARFLIVSILIYHDKIRLTTCACIRVCLANLVIDEYSKKVDGKARH